MSRIGEVVFSKADPFFGHSKSGLSQAGGGAIAASGNGIDIGSAMIAVTIGITVGLFMSQALVYMFGTRKNAAMFSF